LFMASILRTPRYYLLFSDGSSRVRLLTQKGLSLQRSVILIRHFAESESHSPTLDQGLRVHLVGLGTTEAAIPPGHSFYLENLDGVRAYAV
jgi:hypothetical protein